MICTLFLAGSSNAELVIAKKNLEWNIGDYVKYEIMGDTFATDFGKSIGGDDFLEVENCENVFLCEKYGFQDW
mgnify:CR=1 FL=1